MTITNKRLMELLQFYPDESLVYINDSSNYGDTHREISSMTVNYVADDDYAVPEITLD